LQQRLLSPNAEGGAPVRLTEEGQVLKGISVTWTGKSLTYGPQTFLGATRSHSVLGSLLTLFHLKSTDNKVANFVLGGAEHFAALG